MIISIIIIIIRQQVNRPKGGRLPAGRIPVDGGDIILPGKGVVRKDGVYSEWVLELGTKERNQLYQQSKSTFEVGSKRDNIVVLQSAGNVCVQSFLPQRTPATRFLQAVLMLVSIITALQTRECWP
jgi:hypothetical protein